jgi:hypothetical protein
LFNAAKPYSIYVSSFLDVLAAWPRQALKITKTPPAANYQSQYRYKTVVESRFADAAGSPPPGSRSESLQGERLQTHRVARTVCANGGGNLELTQNGFILPV